MEYRPTRSVLHGTVTTLRKGEAIWSPYSKIRSASKATVC